MKISNNQKFKDSMPVSGGMGKNLLVNMQILEYGRGFVGAKVFQNKWNMNVVISGGYGIFNKAALIEVGGYDVKSMGEDMEITLRLHEYYRRTGKKYYMKYVPDSVCWTQGVETYRDLRRQRERWQCGLIQTILKYRKMILNPKYGAVGIFMLPFTIMYELLSPIFMILGWFVIAWCIFDKTINISYAIYLYLVYFVFGVILTTVSFLNKAYMNNDGYAFSDILKCVGVGFVEGIVLRPYLAMISFGAFFKTKKIAEKWESPARVKIQS